MKRFLGFIVCLGLVGCIPPKVVTPEMRSFIDRAMKYPTEFVMPADKAQNAWGRGQAFISKFSAYKIQTSTDFIIETYNRSPGDTGFGYKLTKAPMADGRIKFSIDCWGLGEKEAVENAHMMAFYMYTGVEVPEEDVNL